MKLTKETIAYILEELQSRLEVLSDLIHFAEDEQDKADWVEEQYTCKVAMKELKQC